jgi:cytoskeletal protein CcmA (bactofilin family)
LTRTSLIPAGTELAGRLKCASDLLCEGSFVGEIEVQGDLTIGAAGCVEGPLSARTVTVIGQVRGCVHGEEQVELRRGASVEGDVSSACVVLAGGSDLDGRIDISG